MGRVSDWLKRKVRAPLLAELRQGATPAALATAAAVAFALAIIPIIGATTLLCVLAGRIFRLNHVVMQVVNHLSYPLQILLFIPFIRLGEFLVHADPVPISVGAIVEEFNRSLSGLVQKFGLAYVHGLLGWVVTVPLFCWGLNWLLRTLFQRLRPDPTSP